MVAVQVGQAPPPTASPGRTAAGSPPEPTFDEILTRTATAEGQTDKRPAGAAPRHGRTHDDAPPRPDAADDAHGDDDVAPTDPRQDDEDAAPQAPADAPAQPD
ncbi:MAG TPA: hypothetical protein VHB30_11605, partial [Solirubrobacteraceae bacterium]|nr:hypothetical protein [Solirubrobacteraceae bacterium]